MDLEVGLRAEREIVVTPSITADQEGNPGVNVLSTPQLVRLFETTAIEATKSALESGQGTLGTRLDIRHLAATPVGMRVWTEAELVEVDGRRLVFRLSARDEQEPVGEGTHERHVVDLERFRARAEAKRATGAGGGHKR